MVEYNRSDIIPPEDSLDPAQKVWDRFEQDRRDRESRLTELSPPTKSALPPKSKCIYLPGSLASSLDNISQNEYYQLQRERDMRAGDEDP